MRPAVGEAARGPSVSVVVPTRDRWSLLIPTLASVLAQRDVDFEVVVVDDGSTTPPPAVPALADPRVRLVRNDISRGVARARNLGIERAEAPWIAFLDDDDVWAPTKLRRQLDAAESAGASLAYAGVALVAGDTGTVTLADAPAPEQLSDLLSEYNAIPAGASNVLVKADLVRAVGGFDPDFTHLADWDLWTRLGEVGEGAACRETLVGYRLHPASMRSTVGGALAEMAQLDRKNARPWRPPPGRIWFYRWLSDGQLLAGRRFAATATRLRGAIRCRSRSDAARALRILLPGGLDGDSSPPSDRAEEMSGEDWIRPLIPVGSVPNQVGVRSTWQLSGAVRRGLRMLAAASLGRALRLTGLKAGVVVVYHELRADPGSERSGREEQIGRAVSADAFRDQLEHFRSRYHLVRANELRDAARSRRRGEPFPLAVTFDDDLRSHVDLALPVLSDAGATATFFLTGASLDGPASFWWERIERAVGAGLGPELFGTADAELAVDAVSALPRNERELVSARALERLGGELESSGLRIEHVSAIRASGCEIGFHTRGHERLPGLGDEDLARAMGDGVGDLEAAAGTRLQSVAYPHGDADPRVAEAARSAGFDCGFTTHGAAVRTDTDPFLMGRLYPSQVSLAHLASQLSLAIWRASRDA